MSRLFSIAYEMVNLLIFTNRYAATSGAHFQIVNSSEIQRNTSKIQNV